MPEYVIHICDRDHLYMVCRKVPTRTGTTPVYKTVAECPSMEYAVIMFRSLMAAKAIEDFSSIRKMTDEEIADAIQ